MKRALWASSNCPIFFCRNDTLGVPTSTIEVVNEIIQVVFDRGMASDDSFWFFWFLNDFISFTFFICSYTFFMYSINF